MELKAGRELDALVSEKLMGHTVFRNKRGGWSLGPPEYYDSYGELILSNPLPAYSEDISAAWEVVEKLNETNFMVSTRSYINQPWQSQCLILPKAGENVWITARGKSIPHAICLAALKAVESKTP